MSRDMSHITDGELFADLQTTLTEIHLINRLENSLPEDAERP